MTMEAKVKTRCPICAAKYRVPRKAVGHRAKCLQCKATFRVGQVESPRLRPPTEEDILAWLSEGRDDDFFDYEDNPAAHRRSPQTRPSVDQQVTSVPSQPSHPKPSGLPQSDRRSCVETEQDAQTLQFRKTG